MRQHILSLMHADPCLRILVSVWGWEMMQSNIDRPRAHACVLASRSSILGASGVRTLRDCCSLLAVWLYMGTDKQGRSFEKVAGVGGADTARLLWLAVWLYMGTDKHARAKL